MVLYYTQIGLLEVVLLSALLLAVAVQLFFYLSSYATVTRRAKQLQGVKATGCQEPVSVVVYAHNEADLLEELIPALFQQTHPQFEVVIANDASTDSTRELVERMQTRYANLKHSIVPVESKSPNRKKLALSLAMRAAQYDIFLHTEANCLPLSDQWIESMVTPMNEPIELVVGAYRYNSTSTFFGRFVMFDHLIHTLRYMSAALRGKSYAGFGRNLCYRRRVVERDSLFASHLNIACGDDDLFVHEVANSRNNVGVVTDDSIVVARYQRLKKAWVFMKRNHILSASRFRRSAYRGFAIESASRYFFWGALIAVVAIGYTNPIVVAIALLLAVIRIVVQQIVLVRSAKWMRIKPFVAHLFSYELAAPLINLYYWLFRTSYVRKRRV